ncbi:ABC transporter substrate-binding protein [Chelatococcus asaccharovorans]|uniref:Peptide/nickel transport system substrate-binding protein n=1 Tax=Chelatococcus asaccharovorans TaxID=28210 RepID=A0A2V3UFF7_9HYPH|nr:ABC transporter substrate-binding protein [Chelatococcus asaccharovorans]MBS7707289.1 ABC transporter substrate-binding protein [Chelatococcus asaccharovorans]PXW63471.1 peptide/nickel transport system substrate-binding protein [Chelatococcus asaccharovorans]
MVISIASISRRGLLQSGLGAGVVLTGLPARAQEAPKRGGTIVASTDVQPRSLDPVMGNAPTSDRYTTGHIFDSLLRQEEDGSLSPWLAESWEVTDGGKGIVFRLRRGVTFHDGTPFNAEAVKINLDRTRDPAVGATRAVDLMGIESVEVLDDHTVKIALKEVNAGMLAAFSVEPGMMSSPKALKENSVADYGLKPVGTGPFVFQNWVVGSHVELRRNDSYWRQGVDGKALPYADNLRVRYITNPAVKLIEVKAGSVHVADNIPPNEYPGIERDANLTLLKVPPGVMQWLAFNTRRAPMTDERVRRAVSLAVDRSFIFDLVADGYGAVARGPAAPSGWDYNPEQPKIPPHDIEEARRLLAEAGYGKGLKLSMLIIQREPDTQIAQVIQQQLADVGIEVEINAPDRSAVGAIRQSGAWDIYMARFNVPRPDPVQIYDFHYGRNASQNFALIEGDEDLFAAVDAGRTHLDRDVRKKYYLDVQNILVGKSYYAFLLFREARHVARKNLRNLNVDGGGVWNMAEAWLA